ncbi:hypothetical protein [Streptomyces roseolus]|uniref:hypothetical protein n=1 Tax=Streptomyces roseolus TaxID=67358 RepID=UPI0036F12F08
MTVSRERIDSFARDRMAAGELLTWQFDEDADEVTFFVPPEVAETQYPAEIDGTVVVVHRIPRPTAFTSTNWSRDDFNIPTR